VSVFITADRTIVMVLRKPRSRWLHVCCIGQKRHYRKDGSCKHTEAVIANVKPEFRSRVALKPFGGKAG
jgi:hypothetical protein